MSKDGVRIAKFPRRFRLNPVLNPVLNAVLRRGHRVAPAKFLYREKKLARPERFERPTLRFVV